MIFPASDIRIRHLPIEQGIAAGVLTVALRGTLGGAVIPLRVDVGFGDLITPALRRSEYPTLLDHPTLTIWTCPREPFVAENLHGMVRFDRQHARVKDIWDIAALTTRFGFDGSTLRLAIDRTFGQRVTVPADEFLRTLQPSFYQSDERDKLWSGFLAKKTVWARDLGTLAEAGDIIRRFLEPVWQSAARDEPFDLVWPPGGPWRGADGSKDAHDG